MLRATEIKRSCEGTQPASGAFGVRWLGTAFTRRPPSPPGSRFTPTPPAANSHALTLLLPILALLFFSASAAAGDSYEDRAREALEEARKAYEEDPKNAKNAWKYGRAVYEWADYAKSDKQQEALARQGMALCRDAIKKAPKDPGGHYYLAMNIGQLARVKTWSALGLVKDLEEALLDAISVSPEFNHAGPVRSLGMLYRDAPGWPLSIGSRKNARKHLLKAVELAPDYPENRLVLLETYLEWKEAENILAEYPKVIGMLPHARERLKGTEWEDEWADWDARWHKIQREVATQYER